MREIVAAFVARSPVWRHCASPMRKQAMVTPPQAMA
jgi:hypothetical protein